MRDAMIKLDLTLTEMREVTQALHTRACWIETGTITHRGTDCHKGHGPQPKAIDSHQMKIVTTVDDIIRRLEVQ